MKYKKIKLTNSNLGGARNTNKIKAFTLIELLAIIVILAIIAVITVPIILNIIENSRKGAAIDSAYGYKDAISKYYITELAKNPNYDELNGTYKVTEEGKLTSDEQEEPIEISFSGTSPKGGNLTIDKGTVTNGCLTIGDYALTLTDSEVTETKKGDCSSLVQGDEPAKNKVYADGTEVYFDVDEGKGCTKEEYEANKTKNTAESPLKSGCMKFFAFLDSKDSEIVNLILDHNTTNYVAWVSSTDYDDETKANEVGITYSGEGAPIGEYGKNGNNNRGPLTVLDQLKKDTEVWETEVTSDNYTPSSGDFQWTIDYSEYKARLITAEEVAVITKENRAKGSSAIYAPEEPWTLESSWFLLDKGTADCYDSDSCDTDNVTSKYWWLFDNTKECTTYGCKTADSSTYGYWTSSPHAGNSYTAWEVGRRGDLNSNCVATVNTYGVRPVITVSKSKFLQ